jgi:alpha-glucuronidase
MWNEFLESDTYAKPGALTTVRHVVDGSLEGHELTGMAGVANTGSDRNWCGHDFAQANWYAFGRLAWDPSLAANMIAGEWIPMTWSRDPPVVAAIMALMMGSRETYVSYTMPLGLHHLIGGDHYAPMPENGKAPRPDWTATYYHRADAGGIGFDRTHTGSGGAAQYRSPLRERFDAVESTPDELLLWFHHLPWGRKMRSGRTLWDELVFKYGQGAKEARQMEARWAALAGKVDPERHAVVLARLKVQSREAGEWGLKCLRYFQTFSGKPIPKAMTAGDHR